ncbi:MAG: branched-chain amino acid ABC transporter permease [Paracoccaceae bacterium]
MTGVVQIRPVSERGISNGIWFGILLFALLALSPTLAQWTGETYLLTLIMKAMILATAALSLDLLIGRGGMVSFGHAAFLGLGAYVTGIALTEGISDVITILAMVIATSGLFALITGAISIRTSGVHFIMITLAFGQMLFFTFSSLSKYGGDDGISLWDLPELFGTRVFQSGHGLYYSILIILILTWVFLGRLADSRFGRVLRAAKENELRVATMGYRVYHYRLIAYVIAGMIAGVAGFLFACQAEFVSPATATWPRSGDLIIMVVIGGMGTRNGAVLGALFLVLTEEILSSYTRDWRLIFGPMLVLIVLFTKGGLTGFLDLALGRK